MPTLGTANFREDAAREDTFMEDANFINTALGEIPPPPPRATLTQHINIDADTVARIQDLGLTTARAPGINPEHIRFDTVMQPRRTLMGVDTARVDTAQATIVQDRWTNVAETIREEMQSTVNALETRIGEVDATTDDIYQRLDEQERRISMNENMPTVQESEVQVPEVQVPEEDTKDTILSISKTKKTTEVVVANSILESIASLIKKG